MKKLVDLREDDEQTEIVENYHTGKTGLDETEIRIKRLYYWPNQRQTVQTFINKCAVCQRTKYDRRPLKIEYNITPTATKAFEIELDGTKFLPIKYVIPLCSSLRTKIFWA